MILCLGTTPAIQRSMSFDRILTGDVNRTSDVQQYASGKSINAARVLHTLGYRVVCTGFVGGDSGQFLLNDLDSASIAHNFVRVDPSTRMCVTAIDRAKSSATELIQESQALPPHVYAQLRSKFEELLPKASGVLLSGSLPPGAPADFYADCVSAATIAGKTVVLDAVGEPLRRALKSHPTIVKPNRHELSQTVNLPVETDEQLKSAIRELVSMGTKWAVVTDGAKATIASDGQSFWKLASPVVRVVSPIGSGDSFAAGLIAGVTSGQAVPEACRLAVACGAANAMTDRAGHLTKADVDSLILQITVQAGV
jgi:tagatose 6-phosphate kinase